MSCTITLVNLCLKCDRVLFSVLSLAQQAHQMLFISSRNSSIHINEHSSLNAQMGGRKWSGSFHAALQRCSIEMSLQLLLGFHSFHLLNIQAQVNLVRIDRLISMPLCCWGLHYLEEARDISYANSTETRSK